MTYRGTIRNGVVVFDAPPPLEDGTPVDVEVSGMAKDASARGEPGYDDPARGTPRAILGADLKWAGPPEELDGLLEEVRRMREEDLSRARDEEAPWERAPEQGRT